jgi:hypothetical protein
VPLDERCRFASVLFLRPAPSGGARRLAVVLRYAGSPGLAPARAVLRQPRVSSDQWLQRSVRPE